MPQTDPPPPPNNKTADRLAYIITGSSAFWVIGLTAYIIYKDSKTLDGTKLVLTSLLPVIASWVGTILAYFYTRQNFESANQRVAELTRQVTSQDKLRSIPATDKMIPKAGMFLLHTSDGGETLFGVLDRLQKEGKGQRIPIFDVNERPVCVVHRSVIDRYLAEKSRVVPLDSPPLSPPGADPNTITLRAFLADPAIDKQMKFSFALVGENATLDDVKDAMNQMSQKGACQDVFITKTGKLDEDVRGWITNNIIEENAKV